MMESERRLLEPLRQGDAEALRSAFERHGTMVYNACLRILQDATAAEDATQATFLVLLKKARRLGKGTILASWLYRTATFIARRARQAEFRRRRHERKASEMALEEREGASRPTWQQLRPELDDALAELPVTELQFNQLRDQLHMLVTDTTKRFGPLGPDRLALDDVIEKKLRRQELRNRTLESFSDEQRGALERAARSPPPRHRRPSAPGLFYAGEIHCKGRGESVE